ncbi:hypothetical protein, conserved [Leishmania tarentolae]|uniref:Uncharacterized protein n=1 Tax=Leishmania tarentolae TaxID=5689 RepID=A0A640KSE3_LEITA|nr:hypothetical protein, conserved [Leishmania tarentolae]
MMVRPQLAKRQDTLRQLEELPHDVLRSMLCDMHAQLQEERHVFCQEKKEFEHVQLQLAKLKRDLERAQRQRELESQQESKDAEAAARTSRLLRAAIRRGQEYEKAIARTLDDISQLRYGTRDRDSSSTSLPTPSVAVDLFSFNSPAERCLDVPTEVRARSTPEQKFSRVAAAARTANEEQRRSVLLNDLARRVERVERENRMLQSSIDILSRGDASSLKLYNELESHHPSWARHQKWCPS